MTTIRNANRDTNRPVRISREQYRRLGAQDFFRGRRVERIHGEILETSPIGWQHSLATQRTIEALRLAFGPGFWIHSQNLIQLSDSDPEPDVAVYRGSPRDYTDHPTQACLVVEVADCSLDYDMSTKVELHASAGLADYWVLDLVHHQLHVYRDPATIPERAAYRSQVAYKSGDTIAPLSKPDSSIAVAELLP